ncbi:MAG: DNA translocase FtsK 4TM domain-containing protein, partial [Actinomycetota bacterium]|nr:DNA translocase FtsK 4TM domain-containing protein [Actinomycetota bacterium]
MAGKTGTRRSTARPSSSTSPPKRAGASAVRSVKAPTSRTRTQSVPRNPPARRLRRGAGSAGAGLAKAVGAGARAVGRSRELEHGHRRDGLALGYVALAVVIAAGVWMRAGGPVGTIVNTGVRTVVGSAAWLLPVLLVGIAVTLMRTDPTPDARPRHVVGGVLLALSVLGLWHLAGGAPTDLDGVQHAGGAIGYAAGGPLSTGVTAWLAAPLLVLLGLFGLLVLTATTVRQVPERARALLSRAWPQPHVPAHDEPEPSDEPEDQPTEKLRKPARRRQAAAAEPAEA